MFYNVHIHTFKDEDVPRRFLPLGLVRILATKPGFRIVSKLLNNLNPFSDKDTFDRYVKFVKTGKKATQETIFLDCAQYYPKETRFVVLPMDMAYMGAGEVPRPYTKQLDELAAMARKHSRVIPFIHVDPRRDDYFELFQKYVDQHDFKGVKIYPPLGYFPYDDRLMPVYEVCEKKGLPVLAHCSPYNTVHYKGSKEEIQRLLLKSKSDKPLELYDRSKKEMCAQFTHPENWRLVLNRFPGLKVCLAHFGSEYYWDKFMTNPNAQNNWFYIIKDMIKEYDNLYTDISFTLHNQEFFSTLKVLLSDVTIKDRVLFGSDYYMVQTRTTERRFAIDLRAYLGEKYFDAIAKTNPERFLHNTSL
ncbi:MAG: amidohydrolase [Bacteroidales bacterium]|nr:amidohydrolase [Bacteroidales bacterium]MCF8327783.1 amidohydrolase [Bacteroidales bacterium]